MFEDSIWEKTPDALVIGADEVGRGALAGPIVGCACVFSSTFHHLWRDNPHILIRDSKKLGPLQRDATAMWLREHGIQHHIVKVSAQTIDELGIQHANRHVLTNSIEKVLPHVPSTSITIIVDNMKLGPFKDHKIISVPRAESQSYAVAAASILAKAYRDHLMVELSQEYRKYHWEQNKGYGTAQHRQALMRWGATEHHRKTFLTKLSGRRL